MNNSLVESKSSPSFYQVELDALRFFAFMAVFVHHKTNPLSVLPHLSHSPVIQSLSLIAHALGAYGVNFFFVLSSYLITRLLRMEIALSGRLDIRAFYIRRALRIWPLYFFFLTLCFVISRFVTVLPPLQISFFAAAVLFVNNWWVYTHGLVWLPLLPLWTVAVEEQFYLVWPLLVRHARATSIVALSLTAIIISHITAFWIFARHPAFDSNITTNTFTQIQFFGLGALLALWAEGNSLKLHGTTRFKLLSAGLLLLGVSAGFDLRARVFSAGPWTYNVLYLMNTLGVLLIFRSFLGAPARWFPQWLRYLGKISFGLYVFNDFSGWITRSYREHLSISAEISLTFLLNLALAMASYELLEKPFLKLKRRFELVKTGPKDQSKQSLSDSETLIR